MTTTYLPAVKVGQIRAHGANPRRTVGDVGEPHDHVQSIRVAQALGYVASDVEEQLLRGWCAMTPDDLDALAALAGAASPGPWDYYSTVHADAKVVGQSGHWPADEIAAVSNAPEYYGHANARFIAAARDAVPALIALVHAKQSWIDGAKVDLAALEEESFRWRDAFAKANEAVSAREAEVKRLVTLVNDQRWELDKRDDARARLARLTEPDPALVQIASDGIHAELCDRCQIPWRIARGES